MKQLLTVVMLVFFSLAVQAKVQTQEITYKVGDNEFTGYLAYDDAISGKRPGVIVVHEWWGHNDYARKRTEMLAELGYTAFALDMYGSGKLADHPNDAKQFMQAVMGNLSEVQKRFEAAHKILTDHASVDKDKTAAIGYCMGGGISLHMARFGVDLDGVVSFHGSLGTKTPAKPGQVKARVLVFTGEADPFVPAEQVAAFEKEMKMAGVWFELKGYPGVKHSFTNPAADGFAERFNMPLAYDEAADKDSWQRMLAFFKEIFKD
jgi:dienelactone hydrolase